MSKKILLIGMLCIGSLVLQAQGTGPFGRLRVEGVHLVGESGNTVQLRGMSFGWHNFWPRFYQKQTVRWLKKDFSSNVVRAAIGVDKNLPNSYLQNPQKAKKLLDNVVRGAVRNRMYVVIDWHTHDIYLPEAREFFAYVSKKYGKYDNIIYEVFNEPDYETWPEVKSYAEEIISVIRKNDPYNVILVGTPSWDQDVHLAANDPILTDSNLMYTLHFYAATHKEWLRERADKALEKGLPIFVSESAAMEATGDGPLDTVSWLAYIDWMEKRGISWLTWSVSDKDETCSILYPSASSTGRWGMEDLKLSGRLVRLKLRALAGK